MEKLSRLWGVMPSGTYLKLAHCWSSATEINTHMEICMMISHSTSSSTVRTIQDLAIKALANTTHDSLLFFGSLYCTLGCCLYQKKGRLQIDSNQVSNFFPLQAPNARKRKPTCIVSNKSKQDAAGRSKIPRHYTASCINIVCEQAKATNNHHQFCDKPEIANHANHNMCQVFSPLQQCPIEFHAHEIKHVKFEDMKMTIVNKHFYHLSTTTGFHCHWQLTLSTSLAKSLSIIRKQI